MMIRAELPLQIITDEVTGIWTDHVDPLHLATGGAAAAHLEGVAAHPREGVHLLHAGKDIGAKVPGDTGADQENDVTDPNRNLQVTTEVTDTGAILSRQRGQRRVIKRVDVAMNEQRPLFCLGIQDFCTESYNPFIYLKHRMTSSFSHQLPKKIFFNKANKLLVLWEYHCSNGIFLWVNKVYLKSRNTLCSISEL